MVKNFNFIEKKNKPSFEVELLMEHMMDNIYINTIDYYKKNNITDIILIDPRLDVWRNKLINFTYLVNNHLIGVNKFIYAFNKKNFNIHFGFLFRENDDDLFIKGKNDVYKVNKKNYNIFYTQIKTKKQKENDNMRQFLENLLNNKIKIKKHK
jgi:hypothetical protein